MKKVDSERFKVHLTASFLYLCLKVSFCSRAYFLPLMFMLKTVIWNKVGKIFYRFTQFPFYPTSHFVPSSCYISSLLNSLFVPFFLVYVMFYLTCSCHNPYSPSFLFYPCSHLSPHLFLPYFLVHLVFHFTSSIFHPNLRFPTSLIRQPKCWCHKERITHCGGSDICLARVGKHLERALCGNQNSNS